MAVDMTKRRVDREEFLNKETVGFMDAAHRKGRLSTPPFKEADGKGASRWGSSRWVVDPAFSCFWMPLIEGRLGRNYTIRQKSVVSVIVSEFCVKV